MGIEPLALQPHAGERTDSTATGGVSKGKCFNGSMTQSKNLQGGFTLLEVMISMAIMVLAIATIIPLFAVGSVSHKNAIDQTQRFQPVWQTGKVGDQLRELLERQS